MKRIEFAGQHLILNPDGTLVWREESMLVVADLHLERTQPFAIKSGILQAHDSRETLESLERAIAASGASRILFLGDGYGKAAAHERMSLSELDMLEDLCGALQAVWVLDNPDDAHVPSRARVCEVFSLGGLTFRYKATAQGNGEISGFAQPCLAITQNGHTVTRPCFIEDGNRMIMPAFGRLANGLEARQAAKAARFTDGFNVHVLDFEKIYSLSDDRLAA